MMGIYSGSEGSSPRVPKEAGQQGAKMSRMDK